MKGTQTLHRNAHDTMTAIKAPDDVMDMALSGQLLQVTLLDHQPRRKRTISDIHS